jgi:outer membrane protein assembly factor BamB
MRIPFGNNNSAFFTRIIVGALVLAGAIDDAHANEVPSAQSILEATDIKGGLIVHLGCGDGKLTAELRASDAFVVHGLDRDAKNIAQARQHIRSLDLYGPVAVDTLDGDVLPYTDNLVNLLVANDAGIVAKEEIMRVLAPNGVAYLKDGDSWTKIVKPRPANIDEWNHFLHSPDNNAVCKDSVVGPPHHLQWVGGPKWARGHEVLATISMVVTAGGRIFYIADEGPTASVDLPSQWVLVARDAFNGVLLWKRPIPKWESRYRPFRSGPTHLPRRLVAVGDDVFVTLGLEEPVVRLNAATGNVQMTYAATAGTEEIVFLDQTLYLVAGDLAQQRAADQAVRRGQKMPPVHKTIMAVDAKTGQQHWKKMDTETADQFAQTMALKDGRLYFQNTRAVICLDSATGEQIWRQRRPAALRRPAWSVPTLVAYGDVVLSADRLAAGKIGDDSKPQRIDWTVSFAGGNAPPGEIIALDAKTGERRWSSKCQEGYNAPVDVLLTDGLLWTGNLVKANDPGITKALDPISGEVKRTRPRDQQFFLPGMPHHRCYRNRATDNFVLLGRSGIELVDVKSGKAFANHWVRGTCQFGVLPSNGMIYAPPHTCACYVKTKLNGFNALAPKRAATRKRPKKLQVERGPAFASAVTAEGDADKSNSEDWPTYRHDETRSGVASTTLPANLKHAWQTEIGGQLTSVVVADGKLYVARSDAHSVHALDAATGNPNWEFTTGARIDSPPTVAGSHVYVGCTDGSMYCLRAADGQLAWRFRAGDEDRLLMIDGALESAWPIHGSALVQKDLVYFAAGRSSFLDGGIQLYALDRFTGEVVHTSQVSGRDPKTGEQPKSAIKGFDMPSGLPDVLSSGGANVYMRDLMFDDQFKQQPSAQRHLFSPTGFLDDSWWHRSYWLFGDSFSSGWGGWHRVGNQVPSGRLMVFDDKTIYGFGRNFIPGGNAGQWRKGEYYRLFAAAKEPMPRAKKPPQPNKGRRKRAPVSRVDYKWSNRVEPEVRAMVLAGDVLFVAGPHGETHKNQAAFEGNKGISLQAYSTSDGAKLADYELKSLPVFDGLIAARGQLYLATKDGRILCFVSD